MRKLFLSVTSLNIEQNLTKVTCHCDTKHKISTSRRQVLPDIDLRQTRFRMDWVSMETIKQNHNSRVGCGWLRRLCHSWLDK